MSSTRNNNTVGNYNLQQRSINQQYDTKMYVNSSNGSPYNTAITSGGHALPSFMSRDAFANNSIEIESALFGINSSNLVNPQPAVQPQLKTLRTIEFFSRTPVILPDELIVPLNQRALPLTK